MNFTPKDKNSIKLLFNQIAQNYDKLNNLMSFGLQSTIKKKAVQNTLSLMADIKRPKTRHCEELMTKQSTSQLKILDLCTGTGDIAIYFQKLLSNAEIIGVDFSKEMLSIAKKRAPKITFIESDITTLYPAPSEEQCMADKMNQAASFDIIFISFGLRNLPNIDEFLTNIKPYLKEGGILSILDLGKPTLLMRPYFFFHYNILIPILAKLFNKKVEPYKYFIKSSKTYPSQKELLQKLNAAGYKNAQNINYAFGIISQQIAEK